jgi:internalin A
MKSISFKKLSAILLALCLISSFGCDKADESQVKTLSKPEPVVTATVLTPEQILSNPEVLHERLRVKNPNYQNQAQFEENPEIGLVGDFSKDELTDLSPLQGIPFGALDLRGLTMLSIEPLRGMPLKLLGLEDTRISDLSPLKGMKLVKLYLNNSAVHDLTPLAGMPLTELMLVGTKVEDLGPLHGSPLQFLWVNETHINDISPLSGCPLVSLTLHRTKVADLTPLLNMVSLKRLHIGETALSDLTPLKDLALERLIFNPESIKNGLEIIRNMATLTELGVTLETRMSPAEFWAMVDRGEVK